MVSGYPIGKAFGGILLVLALAACATTPPGKSHDDSLYQALGGMPGIRALVDETTLRVLNDVRIAHFWEGVDLDRFREKLAEQICVEAGGPCRYTGEPMAVVHGGMEINEAEFNALVEDLRAAMDFLRIPETAQNRLLRRLAPMRGAIIHR